MSWQGVRIVEHLSQMFMGRYHGLAGAEWAIVSTKVSF